MKKSFLHKSLNMASGIALMALALSSQAESINSKKEGDFSLTSSDISANEYMSKKHEFQGFGCDGSDLSPQLSWGDAPAATKSFAVMAYDPDAPTGSGWWHWQVVNIPVETKELKTGAGSPNGESIPKGARQLKNDYGIAGFGGACPPKGHGAHRYQFTVYALSVKKLELPEDPSGALTGYMVKANSLASSTLEALYKRD